jgi:predicted nuclease of predicted toxin-antitoxin system
MKIKVDENLPAGLAGLLATHDHDIQTVPGEKLAGAKDPAVWDAAQRESRFLITQDLDFSDVRRFQPGTHYGLLLVRLRMPTRRALLERVRVIFETEDVSSWAGCFVVATDHKLRIRRPGPPTPSPGAN